MAPRRRQRRQPQEREEACADDVGRRVDRERETRPEPGDEQAAAGGAEDRRRVAREPEDRVRLLELVRADGLRNDAGRGRHEERGCNPPYARDTDDVPDLRSAGQQEDRERALRRGADEVRGDHHDVARDPVGPDASDDEEEDLRQEARREHDPEVGRRPRQADDGERQRNRSDRAAEHRDRAAGEE